MIFIHRILFFVISLHLIASSAHAQLNWPPQVGQEFPDITLVDQTGQDVRLKDLKGKVILVEYVAMGSAASEAFAGAQKYGSLYNVQPQAGVKPIVELCPFYAFGIKIGDPRLIFVQILLYEDHTIPSTPEDAKLWADHFHFDRSANQIVLGGTAAFVSQVSHDMVPGFHIVDKDFIVRKGCFGHNPKDNLYTGLLPELAKYVREVK